jgi:hypothetical protein
MINIEQYGEYRMGLTRDEIKSLLVSMYNETAKKKISSIASVRAIKLYEKFGEIAGCNTMTMTSKGEPLMYRWDVDRFCKALFKGIPTYFD